LRQTEAMTVRVAPNETRAIPSGAAAAIFAGTASLLLLGGALAFQYLGGLAPCEMCIWQRWPHGFAIATGLFGGALLSSDILPPNWGRILAFAAIAGLIISGAIGVFHAGVEWKLWPGPSACTGFGYVPGQENFKPLQIVRCDEAQWRLFGISLAGYNAIFSFAAAIAAALMLRSSKVRS